MDELELKLGIYTDVLYSKMELFRKQGKEELAHEVMNVINDLLAIQGMI
ncbi:hypothetical protein L8C07_06020 [Paenibacillus sp. CMAA1739]|nr:hypothetical protein [Paenibacillus sp. CMAA1739]MEC4565496.1 hypothetical protein [Paenibacillus sp. CMAA1739]